MYRFSLIPIILLVWINPLLGQVQPMADHEALTTYIKVWGLLKYHHPATTKGKIDWDQVFIDNVNDAMAADRYAELKPILEKLFEECERVQALKQKVDNLDKHNDLVDFNAPEVPEGLDKNLAERIQLLIQVPVKKQHYLQSRWTGGVLTLRYEPDDFGDTLLPTKEYQVLAVARYWAYVNLFCPYKPQFKRDWNEVLTEYLPKVIESKGDEYYLVMRQFCGEIYDSHYVFWDKRTSAMLGDYYPPISTYLEDTLLTVKWIDTSKLEGEAPVSVGDTIVRVNGKPIGEVISYYHQFDKDANEGANLSYLNLILLRNTSEALKLTVLSNGNPTDVTLPSYQDYFPRWNKARQDSLAYEMLNDSTVVVKIFKVSKEEVKQLLDNEAITKIIIDLHGWGREYSYQYLLQRLAKEKTVYGLTYLPMWTRPGYFAKSEEILKPKGKKLNREIEVKVIVKPHSQSVQEFVALEFQSLDNAQVVGTHTAGALGSVLAFPLPGGIKVLLTNTYTVYPNGEPTYPYGIQPDIETNLKGEELLEMLTK